METSLAETLVEQGIDEIAQALPELATRLGTSKRDWNPPAESVFTQPALTQTADRLSAAVDQRRIPQSLRGDIEHFRFGAAVARGFTPDPVISPAVGAHVRLLWFLMHDHPLANAADLADFIARLSKIDDYTQRASAIARVVDKATIAAQCDALAEGGASVLAENTEIRAYRAGLQSRLDADALRAQFNLVITTSCDIIESLPESLPHAPAGSGAAGLGAAGLGAAGLGAAGSGAAGSGAAYANAILRFTSRELSASDIHAAALKVIEEVDAPLQQERDTGDQRLLDRASAALLDNEAEASAASGREPDRDLDISLLPVAFDVAGLAPAKFHRGTEFNTLHLSPNHVGQFGVESTMLRYGLPGAHLLPDSRLARVIPVPAVSEGWPLYSLTLMNHPETTRHIHFEAVRAAVDTGINGMAWPYDQAVNFVIRHLGVETGFAERLANTIIAEPGAGTAAFAGYRMFVELEAEARARLGSDFDRRQFTRALIGDGERPYSVIKSRVDALTAQAGVP